MCFGLFAFALLLTKPIVSRAQSWQSVDDESFEAIAGSADGTLVLIRYPGDILRSTDHGITWHQVYHGNARLTRIESSNHEKGVEPLTACSDSVSCPRFKR